MQIDHTNEETKTYITKNKNKRELPFDEPRLLEFINKVTEGANVDTKPYIDKALRMVRDKPKMRASKVTDMLILNALERITETETDWTYVAASIYKRRLYKRASLTRMYDKDNMYGEFYSLLTLLTDAGIYSPTLLETYSKEDIKELEAEIVPERDDLFRYEGIHTLADRYLVKDYEGNVAELPQERWMIIAMHLMSQEQFELDRLNLVKEAYWALSNLYMTAATPTMSNAGLTVGQLSSCFIDTVDDSLRGIFDSNTDVANLSKSGGGIGTYMGAVRAKGSSIRNYKGASSGIVPWIKQLNNTAVSVDQLGKRKGSIAVYVDVFHKDIFRFLDLRLNNGDHRMRAHDIFTGVCIPDLFMKQVEKRGEWYLFDPYEVKQKYGMGLQDTFDEREDGAFTSFYEKLVNDEDISKERVQAIDIMKAIMKSQLETGTPYMFYRDEVNRKNPNKHEGMVYSSNLCVEIQQNMSPTTVDTEEIVDGKIITTKSPGDFVVCNLSSVNLPRAVEDDVLERLITIQVRMLDNVIDLNTIEVKQATITNEKYRAVGLGTFGWQHLLVNKGIKWESDEATEYADKLYESIAYYTIKASNELAKEKNPYKLFKGSDWDNGEYFRQRDYTSPKWEELQNSISEHGIRNGYLLAVAPNGTTAVIAGTTQSIDPSRNRVYQLEKSNYRIPVVVPNLTPYTYFLYKTAFHINQHYSIAQNAARQKHIDQSQSFNLFVTKDIKASQLLALHVDAWKSKLKTTYYVRSTSFDEEDCEACT